MKRRLTFSILDVDDIMAIAQGKPIDYVHAAPLREWCHHVLDSTEKYDDDYLKGYREAIKHLLEILPPGR